MPRGKVSPDFWPETLEHPRATERTHHLTPSRRMRRPTSTGWACALVLIDERELSRPMVDRHVEVSIEDTFHLTVSHVRAAVAAASSLPRGQAASTNWPLISRARAAVCSIGAAALCVASFRS